MIEDELRTALHRQAGTHVLGPELLRRAQLGATQRRHRRDVMVSSVGSSVLSILLVLGVVGITGHLDAPGPKSGSGTGADSGSVTINLADSKVEASAPLATAQSATDRPQTLVAASVAGRLVKIDPLTGKTTKVITVDSDPSSPSKGLLLGHIALSPSGTVYFDATAAKGTCGSVIRSVPVNGGNVTDVVSGFAPALNASGSILAYARRDSCNTVSLVTHNLVTGAEHVIAHSVIGGPNNISALSWSADDLEVFADLRFDDPQRNHLAIFPASSSELITQGTSLVPGADAKTGTTWRWGTFLPNGNVFLAEQCCTPDASGTQDDSRMIVVSPTGKLQSVLADGVLTKPHSAMATDPDGNHLLYISGTDLMVSDHNQRPAPLAYGLAGAAWR